MTTRKRASASAVKAPSAGHPGNASAPNQPQSAARAQMLAFEQAVRLFSERKFEQACELFATVVKGPASDVADKARSYYQVCERRIGKSEPKLQSAEDHFNYGVERLNALDPAQARQHFARALALEPDADHILFTMALACGLSGDGEGACENLKRAIELQPQNRVLARQDPEFTALAQHLPGLRALLHRDPSSPF